MMKPQLTIPDMLEKIRVQLDLSAQTEQELLEEIEGHLEEALEEATAQGEAEEIVLHQIAERFGLEEVGQALQEVHAPWESAEAIIACILPVVATLILRWLIFAPDGSAIGWQTLLLRPAFWIVASVVLIVPILKFNRWAYAMISWGFFWTITIIFITLPAIQQW